VKIQLGAESSARKVAQKPTSDHAHDTAPRASTNNVERPLRTRGSTAASTSS